MEFTESKKNKDIMAVGQAKMVESAEGKRRKFAWAVGNLQASVELREASFMLRNNAQLSPSLSFSLVGWLVSSRLSRIPSVWLGNSAYPLPLLGPSSCPNSWPAILAILERVSPSSTFTWLLAYKRKPQRTRKLLKCSV